MRKNPIKHFGVLFLLLVWLAGCKATGHIDPGVVSHVTLGMTKPDVIRTIGNPESSAAEGNTETLYYIEERPWWQWVKMQVKLVDGKVVSYGEAPK